jgi:16S rRNA (guanine(1405)-N(7))-methyltransferase
MAESDVERLVADVRASAKYRHVAAALIERIGAEELGRRGKYKDALKATKNKLHQVAAAYQESAPGYERWLAQLRAVHDAAALKNACHAMMSAHASTRERLEDLESFYAVLFAALPPVGSILDVACGLNPLAIPWMNLPENATYTACDVYEDLAGFLNQALPLLGVKGTAYACDVLGELPEETVDLALVLKTIPCLEQVDRDAGEHLLGGLPAKHIAVSYPVASLGGRSKGMRQNYRAEFLERFSGRQWEVRELDVPGELVFLLSAAE